MQENEISEIVIKEACYVHSAFGPGLLESVYEIALFTRLSQRGLKVRKQVPIPVLLDGVTLEVGFRADLIVEEKLILEIKSVEALHPVVYMQLKTYMRFTGIHVGLVLNFYVNSMKDGIKRYVYQYNGPTLSK
ncbi:MAG TPA: GxxExxY protein [Chitinophagales bacterium]|nr:GxxExxY protein [Chitinophagales bacterium]HNF69627.1 GxxExxY protein [Chitinophagales bacterium]HNI53113.1 GxxExxY protein [Chitinophagales bacterium]HNJ90391.1 GxxExxY protein [Chitinophagales bacterium]HNM08809.1 GxxExxY protein [Chitinophagales bacterium]